jgi:hypothetical protein
MTTVGIKAIDFTKKSRLELLVFSLDIITFLSFKMAAFVGYKPSNIESGTDTIQPPHRGTCWFDPLSRTKNRRWRGDYLSRYRLDISRSSKPVAKTGKIFRELDNENVY